MIQGEERKSERKRDRVKERSAGEGYGTQSERVRIR